jgi:4-hydroxythreonine-4-phosphate dehydrogenase
MGDPASIGPEISLKVFGEKSLYGRCRPLLIGDASVLEKTGEILRERLLIIHPIAQVSEALFQYGTVDILDLRLVDGEKLIPGKVSPIAGNAAFQYVKRAIELALSGEVDATVTNALNKEAMNLAGHHYAGHTEIYAELTGTKKYAMMLACENLRVIHISTHVSLREACDRVKKDRVLEVIRLADAACRDLGIQTPKIGVAGLNPHSGENGLFGTEELTEIIPAIALAKAEGINAEGPIPPDSVFSKARGGWYDIVVAMYHDQGHIPLKLVGFVYNKEKAQWEAVQGVNITLGLPIIRVSVDHGTAFDQAGKGTANALSLKSAVDYAIRLAVERQKKSRGKCGKRNGLTC